MSIEIYWDDITTEKQQEILDTFGENCNYDVYHIVTIETSPELGMEEPSI